MSFANSIKNCKEYLFFPIPLGLYGLFGMLAVFACYDEFYNLNIVFCS